MEDMYISFSVFVCHGLCIRQMVYLCMFLLWVFLFLHAALLPGYILNGLSSYSGLVALVFTVVMGVLACLSECLHVLVHRVVV